MLFLLFAATASAAASTYTRQLCVTQYGASSTSIRTTTNAFTVSLNVQTVSTYTPVYTTTPPTSTTTSTVFSTTTFTTTLPTTTTTISTTATDFTTTTFTTTDTLTATSTITSSSTAPVVTTTVGTSAGFVPIQSQIAGQGYRPAKRNALAIEGLLPRAAPPRTTCRLGFNSKGQPTVSPTRYPTAVSCKALVGVLNTLTKTVTTSKTATKTAATPISTATSTSTVSVTSTVTPDIVSVTSTATITSTISTTTGVVSTTTVSTTTTTTVIPPQATAYAICQQNNYLTTINGGKIDAIDTFGAYSGIGPVRSAENCCNRCASLGSTCAAGIYSPSESYCYFLAQADGSCDPQKIAAQPGVAYYANSPAYVIINTNCGKFDVPKGNIPS